MASLITEFLHRFKSLRNLAKKILRNRTIRQPFYNGFIYFNAVDFSFLWTNNVRAENHDRLIQDKLLELSKQNDVFVDIGSNIGIMTLNVALRNPDIKIRAIDPNVEILNYLKKSIAESKISKNIVVENVAVSDYSGKAFMDFSNGSYAGHIAQAGVEVQVRDFRELLDEYRLTKTLFKIDIEGVEKLLISLLTREKNKLHTYVIEMHPQGFNGISDPPGSVGLLLKEGFTITSVTGEAITDVNQISKWENIVCVYEKQ